MYCQNCGYEIKTGDYKCPQCGGANFSDEVPVFKENVVLKAIKNIIEAPTNSKKTITIAKFLFIYVIITSALIGSVLGSSVVLIGYAVFYLIALVSAIVGLRMLHRRRVVLVASIIAAVVYLTAIPFLLIIMLIQPKLILFAVILLAFAAIPIVLSILCLRSIHKDSKEITR